MRRFGYRFEVFGAFQKSKNMGVFMGQRLSRANQTILMRLNALPKAMLLKLKLGLLLVFLFCLDGIFAYSFQLVTVVFCAGAAFLFASQYCKEDGRYLTKAFFYGGASFVILCYVFVVPPSKVERQEDSILRCRDRLQNYFEELQKGEGMPEVPKIENTYALRDLISDGWYLHALRYDGPPSRSEVDCSVFAIPANEVEAELIAISPPLSLYRDAMVVLKSDGAIDIFLEGSWRENQEILERLDDIPADDSGILDSLYQLTMFNRYKAVYRYGVVGR